MTLAVGVCHIRVELEQFYLPFEGVGDGTLADLDVVRLLKPDDEFLLCQLRVFCMMLAKNNADSIRHCSVLCSL